MSVWEACKGWTEAHDEEAREAVRAAVREAFAAHPGDETVSAEVRTAWDAAIAAAAAASSEEEARKQFDNLTDPTEAAGKAVELPGRLREPAALAVRVFLGSDTAAAEALARWAVEHPRDAAAVRAIGDDVGAPVQGESGWHEGKVLRTVLRNLAGIRGGGLAKLATPEAETLSLREVMVRGEAWAAEAKDRAWCIRDWLPAGELALLAAVGEAGKSTLCLQWAMAFAVGIEQWAASDGGEGPVPALEGPGVAVVANYEDDTHEMVRRVQAIGGKAFATKQPIDIGGENLIALPMRGRGPLHAPAEEGSGHVLTTPELTRAGAELRTLCEDVGAGLLIIDPVSIAFAVDENNRAVVSRVLEDWAGWAGEHGCTVLLVGHPPKSDEDGYSGSSAWHGLVRARMSLAAPKVAQGRKAGVDKEALDKLRSGESLGLPVSKQRRERVMVLTRAKSNYGPPGEVALWLRSRTFFHNGSARGIGWRRCPALEAAEPSASGDGGTQRQGGRRRRRGAAAP